MLGQRHSKSLSFHITPNPPICPRFNHHDYNSFGRVLQPNVAGRVPLNQGLTWPSASEVGAAVGMTGTGSMIGDCGNSRVAVQFILIERLTDGWINTVTISTP